MSAGNGSGGYVCTQEADLAAYDGLPPRLREVLRRAPINMAAKPIALAARLHDPERLRRHLIDDIVRLTAAKCRRDYGPDHPQAGPPA